MSLGKGKGGQASKRAGIIPEGTTLAVGPQSESYLAAFKPENKTIYLNMAHPALRANNQKSFELVISGIVHEGAHATHIQAFEEYSKQYPGKKKEIDDFSFGMAYRLGKAPNMLFYMYQPHEQHAFMVQGAALERMRAILKVEKKGGENAK